MGRFEGRAVLVTGAASGIGAATARRLLDEGAFVTGTDLAEATVDHERFTGVVGDVGDDDSVRAAVQLAASMTGRLDGVMHAAGVAGGGPVHLCEPDEWDRVIRVNLRGTYLVARHAVRQMLAQEAIDGRRGSIVNVASVEGLEGTAGGSAYNASKGGVVTFTKCLAIDHGKQGIRANALCPGFIETPMMSSITDMPGLEAFRQAMIDEHALRRNGRPEEMAAVAAFLLSDDASFVTGSSVVADGGYSAGRDHGITDLLGL